MTMQFGTSQNLCDAGIEREAHPVEMTCSLVPAQKRWTQKRSSHLHPVVHDETVAETEFGGKSIQDCPGLERWGLAEQKQPLLYIARHD
jgi:hypothetical protein